jgi:glycerol-3-phosphate acyltransferase PlsY
MPLGILLIVIGSYLLGSIPSGFLLVRLFRHQDIRSVGSGNIGATNVLRTGSKSLGGATFLLDRLKGSFAVWLGGVLATVLGTSLASPDAMALAALFVILGHMFPVWLRFHGGKGVAAGFGAFLVAAPWAALAAISVFFLILYFSRYVSLASILGAGSFPVFACFLVSGHRSPFFIAIESVVALLIIAKHHQNIRRLLAGNESRFGVKKTA